MKPKFKDAIAWEQAQLLMQPAFIRTIDNIRKQLDESSWQGTYQEIQSPYPGYILCLTQGDRSVNVDLWNLCFEVCFLDYLSNPAETIQEEQEVEIDTSLIDETGEVDWHRLETKTQYLVNRIFASLPTL
ncbi:MAG: hypothetical protein HC847_23000 [Hydrococcus sp. RU_2_2]|nr:hypothetical protein [Hydrococcus sp. RU_2_2]NJP22349.1 hypothetical protein [Hydrococcus sp. CRU_1_1]NJQ97694.1 hypothetical protein [Hydrococcus sp. CSU_1_8]